VTAPTTTRSAADTAASARRRRWRAPHSGVLLPVGTLLAALVLWQLTGSAGGLARYVSSPTGAAAAAAEMTENGELWPSVWTSVVAFAIGFAISCAAGIPIGLLMGWNRTLREFLEPPMMAFYIMPRLALLPLIVVWLGIGTGATVVVVVIDAVFPVIINGMAGVRDADAKLVQVARSFGASGVELFKKVLLPASIPPILTGVRLAVARGIMGVIAAQLYVSTIGIGHLIAVYGQAYRTDHVVVLVLLVAVFGYLVNLALQRVERRFETWRGAS
jgi:sulfonate transport system permease protein